MAEPQAVDAYRLNAHIWVLPCPFCGRLHMHSAAPGLRTPHCPDAMAPVGGYVLRYAGPATPKMRRRAAWRQRQNSEVIALLLADNR